MERFRNGKGTGGEGKKNEGKEGEGKGEESGRKWNLGEFSSMA